MGPDTSLNATLENKTDNHTLREARRHVKPGSEAIYSVILQAIICIFLVLANALLLYCIQKNKTSNWVKQTRQIFYLIVSDFVVGLLMIPIIVNFALKLPPKGYVHCTFIIFIMFYPQVITYYHMLAVCWHRYRMMKRMHLPLPPSDGYRYAIESAIIWLLVLVAFLVPFIVLRPNGGEKGPHVCSPNDLFGEGNRHATLYIMTLYCLPAILTNILYVVILYYLRKNAIQPVSGSMINRNRSKSNQLNVPRGTALPLQELDPPSTVYRPNIVKIVKVIGYLLLVLNISIIPSVLSLSLTNSGTPNAPGALLTFTYLNNICNPFIYSLSITPLREEIKSIIRRMVSRLYSVVQPSWHKPNDREGRNQQHETTPGRGSGVCSGATEPLPKVKFNPHGASLTTRMEPHNDNAPLFRVGEYNQFDDSREETSVDGQMKTKNQTQYGDFNTQQSQPPISEAMEAENVTDSDPKLLLTDTTNVSITSSRSNAHQDTEDG